MQATTFAATPDVPPHRLLADRATGGSAVEVLGWRIGAIKSHIATSAVVDRVTKELDLRLPDMFFPSNELRVQHQDGFELTFTAIDALRTVDNKRDLFKVSYSDAWVRANKGRATDLKSVHPFDWTYSNTYAGTPGPRNQAPQPTERTINMDRLKRPDPILYYNELVLFEDELADNGSTQLSVRVRVMPSCFFVLMRYVLRVDKVLYRILDTRIYHEFGADHVLREQSLREDVAEHVEKKVRPDMDPSTLANVQWLYENLPLRSTTVVSLPVAVLR